LRALLPARPQPLSIIPLVQRFNQRKWERFNSEKVCSISYARIQGRNALVQHFQNSSLMHEDKRCRPILFTLDESGDVAGEQEAFPAARGESGPGSSSGALHPRGDGSSASGSGTKLSGLGGSSNSLRGGASSAHGSSTNLQAQAQAAGGFASAQQQQQQGGSALASASAGTVPGSKQAAGR
jgi:protein phosphatase 1 regulatory subunit 42